VLENVIDHTIAWRYSDDVLLSVDSVVTGADVRYTVDRTDHNASLTTYTLGIRDIVATDADTFTCEILDLETEVNPQLKVELEILKPRTFSTRNIFSSSDQVRKVGNDVTLVCSANNLTPDACYWSKMGAVPGGRWGMVTHNGHSLRQRYKATYQTTPTFRCSLELNNITLSDEATYAWVLLFSPFEKIHFDIDLRVTN
jgi:hypothetical protein